MQPVYNTSSPESGARTDALEYLSFRLGNEEYGIDIQKVQELRGYTRVTRIANVPAYIKGVVNLRGLIVPIVDLRIKFDLGEPRYDQFTVVVIVSVGGTLVGMVVDSVSDVIALSADQVKPVPEMGAVSSSDYLVGMGALEDRMVIMVDIDKLLASDEIALMEKMAT